MEKFVSVLIVDQQLDHKGILANAALVIGLTVGRELPSETFGPDVIDGDGATHRYLTNVGHFVRKAGQSKMRKLKEDLSSKPLVIITDYTEAAAPADYQEYSRNLASMKGEQIQYRALHIYGPEAEVVPLTKNLSRLD